MFFKNLYRRQIVVNAKLQYGVVAFFVGLSSINIAFFLTAYWLSQRQLSEALKGLSGVDQQFAMDILEKQGESFFRASALFSLFSLCLSIILGIVLLNHIAGPVFAIKQYLDARLSGSVARHPLKFRKHDYFYEVADSLTKVFDNDPPDSKETKKPS